MAAEPHSRGGIRSVFLPPHIVVLVHGNNGAASDFDAVEAALLAKFGARQMLIIKSGANEADTSLGVEIGGTRLAKEVVEAVFEYDLSPMVDRYKLSVVGHSLGGLYARYALVQIMGALSCLNVEYCKVELMNCICLWRYPAQDVHPYGAADATAAVQLRPLLEVMSEPESEFVRSLRRFQHGTLVAMTDGDVVVPYPSASMRSFSPYGSTFLTERFLDWRWHIRHSGFTMESDGDSDGDATFMEKLNAKVDSSIDVEQHELGLDATTAPRFPSIEGFDCDNKREVEFPHEMLCSLQGSLPWRRIDVTVEPCGVKGKMRLHDWCINKMQPPDCKANEFIDLLCDMIGADHQMRPLPTPETAGNAQEGPALALCRRLNAVKPAAEQGSATNQQETEPKGDEHPPLEAFSPPYIHAIADFRVVSSIQRHQH
ncbi:hypothetical protein BBJ28_00002717 [Nothophytophthora sp. Chile5]|nr:hypothetical protein BBJ28_00002717 [Nothophytophthora sp. Chile5]